MTKENLIEENLIDIDEDLQETDKNTITIIFMNLIELQNKAIEKQNELNLLNRKIEQAEQAAIEQMQTQDIESITVQGIPFNVEEKSKYTINQGDLENVEEIFAEIGEQNAIKTVKQCHHMTIHRIISSLVGTEENPGTYTLEDLEKLGVKFREWTELKYKIKYDR